MQVFILLGKSKDCGLFHRIAPKGREERKVPEVLNSGNYRLKSKLAENKNAFHVTHTRDSR
jgi:hypothetical protein